MKKMTAVLAALAAWVALAATPAAAQEYPNRPVKLLIGFPVGGLLDTVSRIVGEKMSGLLGQQFIIEARAGAGGSLATSALAKSDPDGYTLMMVNDNHALNPATMKSLPYDSVKDFQMIGFVGYTPLVFVSHPSVPVKNVKELVELAKKQPGQLTYASVGPGSAAHLAGEMFGAAAGVKMLHVPYRGGAPAMTDLLAGHVKTMFLSPVISVRNMEANKLTGLALAADKRLDILKDLPTMKEVGYPLEASYWFGLMAPAKTPPAVVARLEKALAQTLAMPDVQKRFADLGAILRPLNSQQFSAYVGTELTKWADVVKKAGIQPN
ncbi:MAG: tripartite tricarboxylate transporter substrate binding protein [Alphaproteobacteria bacterium]|nr:tripartite tricarboxylate transporter substrate binding protein [Alphaproteobacteria bacterium]